MEWIDVNYCLPKEGKNVMISVHIKNMVPFSVPAVFEEGKFINYKNMEPFLNIEQNEITHWQLFPEPATK